MFAILEIIISQMIRTLFARIPDILGLDHLLRVCLCVCGLFKNVFRRAELSAETQPV